jgi:uncharacterized protein (TIGR04222 family)
MMFYMIDGEKLVRKFRLLEFGMKKPLLGLMGLAVVSATAILSQPAKNPIIQANGVTFLLLYALIIGATLGLCWAIARSLDPTVRLSPPPLPKEADPYEIAYLRKGTNEVTRLVIFHLVQNGYLSIDREEKIVPLPESPPVSSLSPVEQDVFYWFSSARPVKEMFLPSLVYSIEQHCSNYRHTFHLKKLLLETPRIVRVAFWLGRAIVVGVGGYKLVLFLLNGQFYTAAALALAIALALWALQRLCRTPRLSDRGRRYLTTLQRTFEGLNISPGEVDSNNLIVAVLGFSALAGTSYASVEQVFTAGVMSR